MFGFKTEELARTQRRSGGGANGQGPPFDYALLVTIGSSHLGGGTHSCSQEVSLFQAAKILASHASQLRTIIVMHLFSVLCIAGLCVVGSFATAIPDFEEATEVKRMINFEPKDYTTNLFGYQPNLRRAHPRSW